MYSKQYQLLLFIFGCLTVRTVLVVIIPHLSENILRFVAGPIFLLISIGFAVIYIGNLRKTGIETMGKPIWWNHMRPLHGALYFLAATLAMRGSQYASIPLAADVIVGVLASAIHYAL